MSDDLAHRLRNLREALQAGDIDAETYERGLNRLRSEYGAEAVNARLGASSAARMPDISVNVSTDSGTISSAPVSVVGHADQVTFPPAPNPTLAREERALLTYLQHLAGECRALPLGQLDRTDADRTRPGLLALAVVAAGCTTAAQHQQQLGSTAEREMTVGVVQREIRAGLTQDQVAEALGSPNIVTRDASGNETYNKYLGEKRAEIVRDYLHEQGMPLNLMSTISYGEERPLADNATRDGRAQNRRVEVLVLE